MKKKGSKNHSIFSTKNSFFSKNYRGQVWVETVIYTLIAFVMIGLVLAYAKPKIEELQDKTIIEQSIGIIEDINTLILSIAQGGAGNTRLVRLELKKGVLKIDGIEDKIIFEVESKYTYSQPGENVSIGNIKAYTEKRGKFNLVTLTRDYGQEYNLTHREKDEVKSITKALTPLTLILSNQGKTGNKTMIDIST